MAEANNKAKKKRAFANFLDGVVTSKADEALRRFIVDGEVAEPLVASSPSEPAKETNSGNEVASAAVSERVATAEAARRDDGDASAPTKGPERPADSEDDSDVEIIGESATQPQRSSRWKDFMRGTTAPPSSDAVSAAAAAAATNAPQLTAAVADTAAASAMTAKDLESKEDAAELLKKVHAELLKIGAKPLAEYVAVTKQVQAQTQVQGKSGVDEAASDVSGSPNARRKRPASTDPDEDPQPQATRKFKGKGGAGAGGGAGASSPPLEAAAADTTPLAPSTLSSGASLPTFMDPLGMLVTAPSWTLRRRLAMSKTGRLRDIVKISEHKSCVSQLNELAQALGTKAPVYEADSRTGLRCSPDHYVTLFWEDHVFRDPMGQTTVKAGREKMARSALMYFAQPPAGEGEGEGEGQGEGPSGAK